MVYSKLFTLYWSISLPGKRKVGHANGIPKYFLENFFYPRIQTSENYYGSSPEMSFYNPILI